MSTDTETLLRHLNGLKAVLSRESHLKAEVIQPRRNDRPQLRVTNRHAAMLADEITLDHHTVDGYALWWAFSWGEAICPAADLDRAAKDIARVLDGRRNLESREPRQEV